MTAETKQRLADILEGFDDPPLNPERLADLIGEASLRERIYLCEALGRHIKLWDDPAKADRIWTRPSTSGPPGKD